MEIKKPRHRAAVAIIASVCILNIIDLVLTLKSHDTLSFQELNPVANMILNYNPWAIIPFKLSLVVGGSYLLLRHRHHSFTRAMIWIAFMVYLFVVFAWISFIAHHQYLN
jgi:hypothetical protein